MRIRAALLVGLALTVLWAADADAQDCIMCTQGIGGETGGTYHRFLGMGGPSYICNYQGMSCHSDWVSGPCASHDGPCWIVDFQDDEREEVLQTLRAALNGDARAVMTLAALVPKKVVFDSRGERVRLLGCREDEVIATIALN